MSHFIGLMLHVYLAHRRFIDTIVVYWLHIKPMIDDQMPVILYARHYK